MNKRGQILTFFIILLPIFIFVATYVIDMSFNLYRNNKLDNLNKMVIEYGLNHLNDDDVKNKMADLIYKNDGGINSYNLTIKNGVITLKLEKKIDSIFGRIINIDTYNISSSYIGYIKNNKEIIEKG